MEQRHLICILKDLNVLTTIAFKNLSFIIILILFALCRKTTEKSDEIERINLLKKKFNVAYKHYCNPKDSLKLKALNFLVNNMYDQYHFKGKLLDRYNQLIRNTSTPTVEFLRNALDSLKNLYGNDIRPEYDSDVITNAFLIQNIDEAFQCWEIRYEGEKLSFTDFCEYVLPYKLENEFPENWHFVLKSRFQNLKDSIGKKGDFFKVAGIVNDKLKRFKILLDYDYPVDINFNMANQLSVGTCYTATKYVCYPLRALGIPVVVDYTFWGNRSSGHSWNAVISKGKPYPFDAIESRVGYYKIQFTGMDKMNYKPTKIFRKTYSIQRNSLPLANENNEVLPPSLAKLRIKDVTAEYIPVSNISLNLTGSPITNQLSYLCTFDNENWRPVYWGKIKNDKVLYKNMGRDLVYLPCIYKNFEYSFIGNPFILTKQGTTLELKPDFGSKVTIEVDRKYPEDDSNKIVIGDKYELFYWYEGWKSLGAQTANQNILYFKDAPKNALFWIRDLTKGKQERIFTCISGRKQWW